MVKSVYKKKESVAGQFAVKYKSETYCWTKKLIKEYYEQASPGYFLPAFSKSQPAKLVKSFC